MRGEPTDARFRRRVLVVEVLTDDPASPALTTGDLADLNYHVTDGGASGAIVADTVEPVTREAMRGLLMAQGSDPELLGIEG